MRNGSLFFICRSLRGPFLVVYESESGLEVESELEVKQEDTVD